MELGEEEEWGSQFEGCFCGKKLISKRDLVSIYEESKGSISHNYPLAYYL